MRRPTARHGDGRVESAEDRGRHPWRRRPGSGSIGVVRTIVCGVDGSGEAASALAVAARMSSEFHLRLVVAHVATAPRPTDDVALQSARQLLERVAATQGLNGDADRRVEIGDRAGELARIAAEEAAALIVVGARTRGRRQLLSSFATELSGTAHCPVVVVPPRRH